MKSWLERAVNKFRKQLLHHLSVSNGEKLTLTKHLLLRLVSNKLLRFSFDLMSVALAHQAGHFHEEPSQQVGAKAYSFEFTYSKLTKIRLLLHLSNSMKK